MNKEAEKKLEEAIERLGVIDTISECLVRAALEDLKQQPPAGEKVTLGDRLKGSLKYCKEHKTIILSKLPCPCCIQDRLDRAEAINKDLLTASKVGLSYINAIVCKVPRPITELKEDKELIEAAIVKAKIEEPK